MVQKRSYVLHTKVDSTTILLPNSAQPSSLLISAVHPDANCVCAFAFQSQGKFRQRKARSKLFDQDLFRSHKKSSALERRAKESSAHERSLRKNSAILAVWGYSLTREEYEDRKKRPFRYCSWKGCNSSFASSIEAFSKVRTAQLARNAHWDPASSLSSIDASWSQYVRTLKIPFFEGQLKKLRLIDTGLSSASEKELLAAELRLAKAGKAIKAREVTVLRFMAAELRQIDPALNRSTARAMAREKCDWLPAEEELLASLDSLISVLSHCGQFLSKPTPLRRAKADAEGPDGKRRPVQLHWFGEFDRDLLDRHGSEMEFDSDESTSPFCDFARLGGTESCNQLTEFESYRQGYLLDDQPWTVLRRLSTRRCTVHQNILLVPPWWGLGKIDPEEPSRIDSQDCFSAADSMLGKCCDKSAVCYRQTCRLCPRRSELWAAIRSGGEFSPKLSTDFCRHHRPQQQDGSWRRKKKSDRERSTDRPTPKQPKDQPELERSTYESRVTKVWIYRREFARLNAHAHFGERRLRTGFNLALDLFAHTVVTKSQIYADEHFELARVAWHLVEHDVNDRKKEIVMRVASQHSQTAIAKDFGISRQAVHGALKSVPKCFRFDLPPVKQDELQLVTP